MMLDNNTSWMQGGIAVSFIGIGLISAFITGPIILTRESEKLGWPAQCKQIVISELKQSQPQQQFSPQLDYRDMARGWFGRDADPFLELMRPLGQIVDQANEQKERLRRLNEERLRQKVQMAGSRCDCAVSILSEQRIALGLYAGTGRLVTPPMFKNLTSELQTALQGPRCNANTYSSDRG